MAPVSAAERQRLCCERLNADPERKEKHLQKKGEMEAEKRKEGKVFMRSMSETKDKGANYGGEQQKKSRLKRKVTVPGPGPSSLERATITVSLHITAW